MTRPTDLPDFTQPLLSWQQSHWQRITHSLEHMPSALLLGGNAGTGKRLFALHLAAWLVCLERLPERACGHCASCLALRANAHADIKWVSPEVDTKGKISKTLKIEQIRDLIPFVQQTSSGFRVVVIEPAELMGIGASNALLKTLEEPAPQVIMILIADHPLQLSATIRSRVQHYGLGRIAPALALDFMLQQGIENQTQAEILLKLSGNAPLAALQLAQKPVFNLRADWLSDWLGLLAKRQQPLAVSARWQKYDLNVLDWLMLLDWLLRDVWAWRFGLPVIQTDLYLNDLAAALNSEKIIELQHRIQAARQSQQQNIQPALVFDALIMALTA